ncbi:MAG: DUF3857 domain-containing protein [Marinilabiliaceae bacterium]|nr:DUF3857 domain-containing protein [Marinilabiliaceae bacterium]
MLQVYKLLFLLSILGLSSLYLEAKDAPHYAVDKIPAELKKNANAVIRSEELSFEVLSSSKGKLSTRYAVTILKEGAVNLSVLRLTYDKLKKVSNIEGTIYDAQGKRVKKIKNDEIKDFSAISGATLFSDNRVKYIDPEYYNYPFTIEYAYSTDYNTLFFMPSWSAYNGYNVSVEKSSFSVTCPSSYKLRYRESHVKANIEDNSTTENTMTYQWNIENFKALASEPMSPYIIELVPNVDLAASSFEMDGIKGSLESWKDIGLFMNQLIKDRDQLPQQTIEEVQALVEGIEDKKEVIAKIYQYSQNKNRYISIQEGVGGWQPFPAETVDRLSYGDCKALSNYTKALLKTVGIKSHYTRILAGSRTYSAPKDFSMNFFNHVILCVPCEKDTVWLECTSSHAPCGYMGDFTDDRYALVVTENGGEYIKTPMFSAEENRQAINSTVQINADNGLLVNAEIKYTGAQYGDEYYQMYRDEKDRRKSIISSIDIANFNLINYDLIDNRESTPVFTKKLELEATNYCTKMGDKTLLKLNVFNASDYVPRFVRNRKNPVYIQRNYSECDTIRFEIPENLKVEALPKAIDLETEYGHYRCKAELADDQIIYYRYFQINKGEYPKEAYEPFREFIEQVSTSDNAKTMLYRLPIKTSDKKITL